MAIAATSAPGAWYEGPHGRAWFTGVALIKGQDPVAAVTKLVHNKRLAWKKKDFRNWNLVPGNARLRRKLAEEESLILYTLDLNGGTHNFVEATNLKDAIVLLENGRPTTILDPGKGIRMNWATLGVRLALSPREPGVVLYQFDTNGARFRGKSPIAGAARFNPPLAVPTNAGKTSNILKISNNTGNTLNLWLKFRFYNGPTKGWLWKKQGPITLNKSGNHTVMVSGKPVLVDSYYLFAQAKNGFRTYGSWDKLIKVKDRIQTSHLASHALEN